MLRLWNRFSDWLWFQVEFWLDDDDDDASGAGIDDEGSR